MSEQDWIEVQGTLRDLGLYGDEIDGIPGPATKRAVYAYYRQMIEDLERDGEAFCADVRKEYRKYDKSGLSDNGSWEVTLGEEKMFTLGITAVNGTFLLKYGNDFDEWLYGHDVPGHGFECWYSNDNGTQGEIESVSVKVRDKYQYSVASGKCETSRILNGGRIGLLRGEGNSPGILVR
jgi:hypothetical protein